MSGITDWEPEMREVINWEERYNRLFDINEELQLKNQQSLCKIEALEKHNQALIRTNESMARDSRELQANFTCFRADAITSLKAIDLCILASLCTDRQWLTHKARNLRMRHVHQIICNEIASLGDRKLITYEDDF